MAGTAPIIFQLPNAFNIGTDFSGVISDAFGTTRNLDEFGHLEEMEARAEQHDIKISPISRGGIPLFQTLWAGGSGHVRYTRVFGAISAVWVQLMNNYYYLHALPSFTIGTTMLNRDGSVDEYLFTGVVLTAPTWGNVRGDKQVDQELHFKFQNCQVVGPGAPPAGTQPLASF
jgi:hypothetical protein